MSIAFLSQAQPRLGIVLGSGLGAVADRLGIEAEVPYASLPELPVPRVPGHAGRLVLARPGGVPVLVAQGRSHLYEGNSAAQVTAQVRLMHAMGVRTLLLTNAAGCINTGFAAGELMLISDHLNLTSASPLTGSPQFVDMSEVYSPRLRETWKAAALRLAIPLHEGVYAGLPGPQYETPAEVRMLRVLGADAVGMSTVLEAIQARALGLEVVGLSMLTNWAAGLTPETLNHEEVIATGQGLTGQVEAMVRAWAEECEGGVLR